MCFTVKVYINYMAPRQFWPHGYFLYSCIVYRGPQGDATCRISELLALYFQRKKLLRPFSYTRVTRALPFLTSGALLIQICRCHPGNVTSLNTLNEPRLVILNLWGLIYITFVGDHKVMLHEKFLHSWHCSFIAEVFNAFSYTLSYPHGGANFDPADMNYIIIVEDHMVILHAKHLSSEHRRF
jgi:hypothetical protein